MTFHTHDSILKTKTNKLLKRLLLCCYVFLTGVILFIAIVTSVSMKSVVPGILIFTLFASLSVFSYAMYFDMAKAYVQIEENHITIADYYFFIKKEKMISVQKIMKAEILPGISSRMRGARMSRLSYIVFMDENDQYLFKVMCSPETEKFFGKYFEK